MSNKTIMAVSVLVAVCFVVIWELRQSHETPKEPVAKAATELPLEPVNRATMNHLTLAFDPPLSANTNTKLHEAFETHLEESEALANCIGVGLQSPVGVSVAELSFSMNEDRVLSDIQVHSAQKSVTVAPGIHDCIRGTLGRLPIGVSERKVEVLARFVIETTQPPE